MKSISSEQKKALFEAALKVRNNSHSPYSGYKVAAAVLSAEGNIFAGVNVENASYGATICAERSAIFSAVTAGSKSISAVLVLTDSQEPWPPCGMCRQVISEFSKSDTSVFIANLSGIQKELSMAELLPFAFNDSHLK